MIDGKRSFTIKEIRKPGQKNKSGSLKKTASVDGSRFVSSTPEGAARKAFTAACRNKKIKGQCTLMVTMTETTRGSEGNDYSYSLKRVKLDNPKVIKRGDSEVTIEYETKSKSLN